MPGITARRTVLAIVGMPGAGKSLASSAGRRSRIRVFVSGDVIRSEARRRGIRFSRKSLGQLMLKIRKEEGMGAVAKRLIPSIEKVSDLVMIYEGARNVEEIEELRRKYRVVIIGIHASPQTRFRRLLRRRRSDRPHNWKDFVERDDRELTVGIGKIIALADHMVENEGSKDDLKRRMIGLLERLRR